MIGRILIAMVLMLGTANAQSPADTVKKPPVDLSKIVLDFTGKPVPDTTFVTPADPQCEKCAPLTLAGVLVRALISPLEEDKSGDPLQGLTRYMLAQRINATPSAVELTTEEVVVLKRRIGRAWGPLVSGQTILAIDPGAKPPQLQ